MTTFGELCRRNRGAPFFLLLYVGRDVEQAARVRATVAKTCDLRGFWQAASLSEAAVLAASKALHVGLFDGCVLLVWEAEHVAAALTQSLPGRPSGQVAGFVLSSDEEPLTLHEFFNLIDGDFAGLGDLDSCLLSLKGWCGGPSPGGTALDLTPPFEKQPSRWLRDLKHDYIVNTVLTRKQFFAQSDLWEAQQEIDLIANVLRNLLCPEARISTRGMAAESMEEESTLYRTIYSTPTRIVAPRSLAQALATEYEEGVEYVLYQDIQAASDLLDAAGREGHARILFRTPDAELPKAQPVVAPPSWLPTVLVAEQAPLMSWRGWQARLASNVVGSFAVSELTGKRNGTPLLAAQHSFWRACAFLSLPELFDRLVELLTRTHGALEDKPEIQARVFRSLASVVAARGVYLCQSIIHTDL